MGAELEKKGLDVSTRVAIAVLWVATVLLILWR